MRLFTLSIIAFVALFSLFGLSVVDVLILVSDLSKEGKIELRTFNKTV